LFILGGDKMKVIYVRDIIDLFDSVVEIYHKGQFVGSNDDVLGWVNNLAVESIVDEEGIIIIET
jgi:hypothetical protein